VQWRGSKRWVFIEVINHRQHGNGWNGIGCRKLFDMRKLIFILLAFISVASYGQTKQTIKQLTVNDSLTIKAGNPAANKIATSIDGNGRFRWVYFSDFQDSINTGVYDTASFNTVRIRAPFTNQIMSLGTDSIVEGCGVGCDDIRWKTVNGAQTVLRDSTDNVGIGTSNPTAKLHSVGSILVKTDNIGSTINATFKTGNGILLSRESELLDGMAIIGRKNTNADLVYSGVVWENANSEFGYRIAGYDTTNPSIMGQISVDKGGFQLNGFNLSNPSNEVVISGTNINGLITYTAGFKHQFAGDVVIGVASGGESSFKLVDGTQADGYVLTSDASGNATWQDPNAYGEMGFGDSTRTIALTQNVFSVVTNSNNTLWQTAAIDLHNVTYSGDSLIIDSAGVYQVNVQLSMDGTSGSIIRLGVFLNGVLACSCTGYQELLNNRILQLTYINIDALNAGDVLKVVITNTANNDNVDAVGGKITVNKIR
jgi:TusA-related sulfurtransferase